MASYPSNQHQSTLTLSKAQATQATCFEDLPVEIKTMILSAAPDMKSLLSIINASPAYYRAYSGAKKQVLTAVALGGLIKHQLDFLDPLTATRAAQIVQSNVMDDDYDDKAKSFLRQWQQAGSHPSPTPTNLEIDECLALIRMQYLVTLVTQSFFEVVISADFGATQGLDHRKLSTSERYRIHRALYRWEIYSQILGYPYVFMELPMSYPVQGLAGAKQQAEVFLSHLPWQEVEELGTIYGYERRLDSYISEKCPLPDKDIKGYVKDFYGPIDASADGLLGLQFLAKVLDSPLEKAQELFVDHWNISPNTSFEAVKYTHGCTLDEREMSADHTHTPLNLLKWRFWGYVMWDRKRLEDSGFSQVELSQLC